MSLRTYSLYRTKANGKEMGFILILKLNKGLAYYIVFDVKGCERGSGSRSVKTVKQWCYREVIHFKRKKQ